MVEPVEEPQPKAGPYSIGSDHWPGTSKLIEELGELQQALGKMIAVGGEVDHWDGGKPLDQRIADEVADVLAAIRFFRARNRLAGGLFIDNRCELKYRLFCQWHHEQESR